MATDYPVLRWQVGDVRITRVVEAEGPTPGSFLFAEAAPEKLLQHAWLQPHFMTAEGMLISSIHTFVIESRARVVVVDTCIGNDKPREFLEKYKDGKALVLGTHFAAPTGGRIVRDAGNFRFKVS